MRAWVSQGLMVFDLGVIAYFLAINTLYLLFSVVAFFALIQHRRRWTSRALDVVMRSPATPAISVIAPAYNEEATIEQSLRSLLLLNYPQFEVVVVNDGSKDKTIETMVAAFGLMRAPVVYQQPLDTQPVRALYRSLDNPDLVVIDKANGGKADAINAARYPLVCVIDADSILEPEALMRASLPFVENPNTLAAGHRLCPTAIAGRRGLRRDDLHHLGATRGDVVPALSQGAAPVVAGGNRRDRKLRLPPADDLLAAQGRDRLPAQEAGLGRDDAEGLRENLDGQVEPEAGTAARRVGHVEHAAVLSHDRVRNGQAKAGAALLVCGRALHLLERLEDRLAKRRGHARPLIIDRHPNAVGGR